MTLLGIDFGLRKIGLALSSAGLAEPLLVVENNAKVFARLKKICAEEKVEQIVVGQPEGRIGQAAAEFGQQLGREVGLPVVFESEVLTTVEAQEKMIQSGRGRRWRRQNEDAISAALLLEAFLKKV